MEAIVDASQNGEPSTGVSTAKLELSPRQYQDFCNEVRMQPNWRAEADRAADYYDGNQLTQDEVAELNRQKLGSLMANLIKPSIDTVLGIEAKMRQDWKVAADDDQWSEVAEGMNAKLHEAERMTRADRACSEAYAAQVKSGLGWVEVSRNVDPFKYPYRANSIHRREMFWDWSSREPDLDDARYVMRRRWYPVEQAALYMPKSSDLIKAAGRGWTGEWLEQAKEDVSLRNSFDQEARTSIMDWDWRNLEMNRVCLNEVWYPVYVRGYVVTLPDERTVEFDRKNPLHQHGVAVGMLKPRLAVFRKMRASIWMGPHKLQDIDVGGNKMPYVPFWGFREDLTGVPYGLVRAMMPLQDEINKRRQRLMWLLNSKRVQMDSDALNHKFNDHRDFLDEVNRPDSVVVLNPNRVNKQGAIMIETDLGLASQQFEIMVEAKEAIQSAAGIFNSMMGKTDGAKSGLAINALVEQGSNTMGDINDNFRFSRNLVGERLLDMIRADMSGAPVTVMSEERSGFRKTIMLNTPKVDPSTGIQYRDNDVSKAQVKVVLEDVPSTPTYKAQQLQQISEVLKGMPPEMSGVLIPFFIENTDLKDRKEMARLLRMQMGLMDPNGQPVDPQVAALQQQMQAMQQQSEQMSQAYEQAVQEQSDKAKQYGDQLSQLKVQMANKQGELQVRLKELQATKDKNESDTIARSRELRLREKELDQNREKAKGELSIKAASLGATHEKGMADTAIKAVQAAHTVQKGEHGMVMAEHQHALQSFSTGHDKGMAQAQFQHQRMRDEIGDVHMEADRAHQTAQQQDQWAHETEVSDTQHKRDQKARQQERSHSVADRNHAAHEARHSAAVQQRGKAKESETKHAGLSKEEVQAHVDKAVKAAIAEFAKQHTKKGPRNVKVHRDPVTGKVAGMTIDDSEPDVGDPNEAQEPNE